MLRIGIGRYDRTQALIDGRVTVAGYDTQVDSPPIETLFATAFDTEQYDVAELSFSNFLYLTATSGCRYVGLPIFPSRMFRHSAIFVRADRGIRSPRDLIGRTVGVREFSMTAALVARGILQDDYGVRSDQIDWRCGPADDSDTRPVIRVLPRGVRVQIVDDGQNLSDLLAAGELDAMVAYKPPKAFLEGVPGVVRLFPEPAWVEQDYFARTGIFPIMHLVGIRRELAEDAALCRAVCEAFSRARDEAIEAMGAYQALSVSLPWAASTLDSVRARMGSNFWPYGVQPNRSAIEALCRYSFEQGLAPKTLTPEDLFARDTLAWQA
jgi:4,5-dihydroxyphthalate decarboxylase